MAVEPNSTPQSFLSWVDAAHTLFGASEMDKRSYTNIGDVTVLLGTSSGIDSYDVLFYNSSRGQVRVRLHDRKITGADHNIVSATSISWRAYLRDKPPELSTIELWRIPESEMLLRVTSVSTFVHALYTYSPAEVGSRSIEEYLHAR